MRSHRRLIIMVAFWLCLAFWLSPFARATTAAEIANKLETIKGTVATETTTMLKSNRLHGSYTTVWRQFEDVAIVALERILPRHLPELSATNFDRGTSGREKNRLADLALRVGGETIEISIKAARKSGNPENDMGTFRDHPNRKKLFAASFTLWVRYEEADKEIRCDRVFFDRTWRFVGKSSLVDGVKYRKKDGNLRPKPWVMFDSGESFWNSEAVFENAVKRAEVYRANELIKEYLDDLSDNDQRLLYEKLKPKFESSDGKNQGASQPAWPTRRRPESARDSMRHPAAVSVGQIAGNLVCTLDEPATLRLLNQR